MCIAKGIIGTESVIYSRKWTVSTYLAMMLQLPCAVVQDAKLLHTSKKVNLQHNTKPTLFIPILMGSKYRREIRCWYARQSFFVRAPSFELSEGSLWHQRITPWTFPNVFPTSTAFACWAWGFIIPSSAIQHSTDMVAPGLILYHSDVPLLSILTCEHLLIIRMLIQQYPSKQHLPTSACWNGSHLHL